MFCYLGNECETSTDEVKEQVINLRDQVSILRDAQATFLWKEATLREQMSLNTISNRDSFHHLDMINNDIKLSLTQHQQTIQSVLQNITRIDSENEEQKQSLMDNQALTTHNISNLVIANDALQLSLTQLQHQHQSLVQNLTQMESERDQLTTTIDLLRNDIDDLKKSFQDVLLNITSIQAETTDPEEDHPDLEQLANEGNHQSF